MLIGPDEIVYGEVGNEEVKIVGKLTNSIFAPLRVRLPDNRG